jgi:hypothetical protein
MLGEVAVAGAVSVREIFLVKAFLRHAIVT